jgi:hypothetical protein
VGYDTICIENERKITMPSNNSKYSQEMSEKTVKFIVDLGMDGHIQYIS